MEFQRHGIPEIQKFRNWKFREFRDTILIRNQPPLILPLPPLRISRIYKPMNNPVHTKTFKSGNSVAVRLPKGFAIPANVEVALEKSGDTVIIRTLRDPVAAKKALLVMLDELQKLPKPPTVQKRDPFEFPDRSGL